jgi:hypothetical protein
LSPEPLEDDRGSGKAKVGEKQAYTTSVLLAKTGKWQAGVERQERAGVGSKGGMTGGTGPNQDKKPQPQVAGEAERGKDVDGKVRGDQTRAAASLPAWVV